MEELVLNPEIEKILPKLSKEETDNLEESILKEGCRDHLIAWEFKNKLVLIDGYNRYKICKKHNIDFKIKKMNFDKVLDVKIWIEKNQLSRRNLNDEQRTYIMGILYKDMKLQQGGSEKSTGHNDQLKEKNTAKEVGEQFDASEKTVRRAEKYVDSVDKIEELGGKKTKEKILSGEIKSSKKDVIELSDKSEKVQKKVIEKIKNGEAESIKEAVEKVEGKKKEENDIGNYGKAQAFEMETLYIQEILNSIKGFMYKEPCVVYGGEAPVKIGVIKNLSAESYTLGQKIPTVTLKLDYGSEIEINVLDFDHCFVMS